MTPLLSAAAWSWEWQPAAAIHNAASRHGIIHLSVFICDLLEVSEMRARLRLAASTLKEPAAVDLRGSKSRTSTGARFGKIRANPGSLLRCHCFPPDEAPSIPEPEAPRPPSLLGTGIRIYLQGEWG